jgi:hypothetical protein
MRHQGEPVKDEPDDDLIGGFEESRARLPVSEFRRVAEPADRRAPGGCPRIGIVARKWRSEAKLAQVRGE